MTKRLFIAIPLEFQIKEELLHSIKTRELTGLKITSYENLHLTVCFLGDVKDADLPDLTSRLKAAYQDLPAFDLQFDRITLAPFNRPPNMIWALLKNNADFLRLAKLAVSACSAVAPEIENKEVLPHVTLARFKDITPVEAIIIEQPSITLIKVKQVRLVESQLTSNGPIYEDMEKISLME